MTRLYLVPESVLKKEAKTIKKASNSNIPYTKILDLLITELGFLHYNHYKEILTTNKNSAHTYNLTDLDLIELKALEKKYLDIFRKMDVNLQSIHFIESVICDFIITFQKEKDQYMLSSYLAIYPVLHNLDTKIINSDYSLEEDGLNLFISYFINKYKNFEINENKYNEIDKRRFYLGSEIDLIDFEWFELEVVLRNTDRIDSYAEFLLKQLYVYKSKDASFEDIKNNIKERIIKEKKFILNKFQNKDTEVQIPILKNKDNILDASNKILKEKPYGLLLGEQEINKSFFNKEINLLEIDREECEKNLFFLGGAGSGITHCLYSILLHNILNNQGFFIFNIDGDNTVPWVINTIAAIKNKENKIVYITKHNLKDITEKQIISYIKNRKIIVLNYSIEILPEIERHEFYSFMKLFNKTLLEMDNLYPTYPYSIVYSRIDSLIKNEEVLGSISSVLNVNSTNHIFLQSYYVSNKFSDTLLNKVGNVLVYKTECEEFYPFLKDNFNFNGIRLNIRDMYYLQPGQFYFFKDKVLQSPQPYKSIYCDFKDVRGIYINLID